MTRQSLLRQLLAALLIGLLLVVALEAAAHDCGHHGNDSGASCALCSFFHSAADQPPQPALLAPDTVACATPLYRYCGFANHIDSPAGPRAPPAS